MIGGEFNTPADWIRSGNIMPIIDDFTATHGGVGVVRGHRRTAVGEEETAGIPAATRRAVGLRWPRRRPRQRRDRGRRGSWETAQTVGIPCEIPTQVSFHTWQFAGQAFDDALPWIAARVGAV